MVLPLDLKEQGKGRLLLFLLITSLISFQVAFKSFFDCSNLSS